MPGRKSTSLPKYIPKGGKNLEEIKVSETFKVLKNSDCARIAINYLFTSIGKKLLSRDIADKNKFQAAYYLQECESYFEKTTDPKFFGGHFAEGKIILDKFRGIEDYKNVSSFLQGCSNDELCKMLSAHLMLDTALSNYKNGIFRCNRLTVPGLRINTENERIKLTSNHCEKFQNSCTLKKQSDYHKTKVSASKNGHICQEVCGKSGCCEANYLESAKDNPLANPTTTVGYFYYDELEYGSCRNCDLKLRKAGLPLYMVLTQPNTVYINQDAPNYDFVIGKINANKNNGTQGGLFD